MFVPLQFGGTTRAVAFTMDESLRTANGNGASRAPNGRNTAERSSSLGDLIPRLANETIDLAKTELLRLKLEVAARSKSAIKTAIFGAALLVFGLMMLLTLITASILSLGAAMDSYGAGAFIVTGILAIISGVCFALLKAAASQITVKRALPDGKTELVMPAERQLAAEVGHARSESEHHGVGKQLQVVKEQNLE